MSETAQTLINSALRAIGVLAKGETPSSDDSADALKALQFMLENWSATPIRLWFVTNENFAFAASPSTIGDGGTLNTVRPERILTAYLRDSHGTDVPLEIIEYAKWARISLKSLTGVPGYLFYAPEYPLGKIYLYPTGTGTLYIDSLKPLTDPTLVTSTVSFPPEYNAAIKWNLAVNLAPEYGKTVSEVIVALALSSLKALENKNFNDRITQASPEIIRVASRYNIDAGE